MQGRRQCAPARHESFSVSSEANDPRVGFQVNLVGPAATKSVIQAVRDAINLSLWTSRCRLCNQAIPTGITGSMHIEKCDPVSFAKGTALEVEHLTAYLSERAGGNMAGNQWIRHTLQPALLQVNVRATDFREFNSEQS